MAQDPNIFGNGDELYGNARLGSEFNSWNLYAYGFRRAAEILMKHVDDRHTSLDVIVFPIVFLYRHHLELAIKLIARDARLLLPDEPPPKKPEHRLQALWDEAKRLIILVLGVEPFGLEPIDGGVVVQFDAIDSRSTNFRYPEAFDGSKPLSHISNINLLTLRDSLDTAFDLLDGGHEMLRIELERRGETG